MQGYLTECCKFVKVADAATATTGDLACSSVDMAEDGGYDGVVFFTSYGTSAADNILKASQSSDDSTFAEYGSTAQVTTGASPTNEDVILDIYRPTARYVKAVPERGTSTTIGDVWALRYKSRNIPVTSHAVSGTSTITQVSSPAEA